jgi:organic radical activating enzyme
MGQEIMFCRARGPNTACEYCTGNHSPQRGQHKARKNERRVLTAARDLVDRIDLVAETARAVNHSVSGGWYEVPARAASSMPSSGLG